MILLIPSKTLFVKDWSILKFNNSLFIISSRILSESDWKLNFSIILCKHIPAFIPFGKILSGLGKYDSLKIFLLK